MDRVVETSESVIGFLEAISPPLSKPQLTHAAAFIDTILVLDGSISLARINRALGEPNHQSALTDFFTYSTWEEEALRKAAQRYLVQWILSAAKRYGTEEPILISIDDSLSKKPKTSHHFQPVEWHFDANGGRRYGHGVVFLTCHIQYGRRSTPISWRLYMREKTIRKLNKERSGKKRLRFKTKYKLAMEMLSEIAELIPSSVAVFVMFDSWYASDKLIRFCLRKNWDVICALKCNRCFGGRRLSHIARYLRNESFNPVWVGSTADSTKYLVHTRKGYLGKLQEKVRVIISKRHNRDKRPEYFMCTESKVGTKKVLNRYSKRWACEIDHLYLKTRLGLEGFRIRSVEGITKYFSLTFLSLAYLHWRRGDAGSLDEKTLAELISQHRGQHFGELLRRFGKEVLRWRSIDHAFKTVFPEMQ